MVIQPKAEKWLSIPDGDFEEIKGIVMAFVSAGFHLFLTPNMYRAVAAAYEERGLELPPNVVRQEKMPA